MSRPKPGASAFSLASTADIPRAMSTLNRELAGRYRFLRQGPPRRAEVALYDTFDWRLYRAGLALLSISGRAELLSTSDGSLLSVDDGGALSATVVRPDSLPAPARRLLSAAGPRTLLRVCDLSLHSTEVRVLDDIAKTIGRATWTRAPKTGWHGIILSALRGFDSQISALAAEASGEDEAGYAPFLRSALALGGREPGLYSGRVQLAFPADEPVEHSLARVIVYFAAVASENLPGILNDWDTEFLHDFRVALRRLSSVLSHARAVLQPGELALLSRTVRDLAGATGELRDLDVILGREASYRSALPDSLHPGLGDFFRWARGRRQAAFLGLVQRMTTEQAGGSLQALRDAACRLEAAATGRTAGACALQWTAGRLRKTLSRLRATTLLQEDGLHALRIQCKKLRYLLEVFGSLIDQARAGALTDRLKELQDILGLLNDLSVQDRLLTQMLERMQREGGQLVHVAASIGGLITEIAWRRPPLLEKFSLARERFHRLAVSGATRAALGLPQGGAQ